MDPKHSSSDVSSRKNKSNTDDEGDGKPKRARRGIDDLSSTMGNITISTTSQTTVQKPSCKRKAKPLPIDEANNRKISKIGVDDKLNANFKNNTYSKGGLVHSLHGVVYQLKLLSLFLKRALDNEYEFDLGTEVRDADTFDDIVFKYKREDATGDVVRFVQVKHKQDESIKIKVNDLLKTANAKSNDFSLQKYFMAFCKIKNNPKFRNLKLKDFIIYTNSHFDDLEASSIEIEHVYEEDEILDVTSSGKATERCKLIIPKDHDLYEKLRETSDLHVLAKTLQQHISENKKRWLNDVFSQYHVALCKKIFDVDVEKVRTINQKETKVCFAKFRKHFLDGINISNEIRLFRNVFQSTFKCDDNYTFWKDLGQKKLEISSNFGKEDDSSISDLPSDEIRDSDIEEFLDKLIFAVNQPNEVELGKIITEELGRLSKFSLLDAKLISASFQSIMLDFFKEKGKVKGEEGTWLNAESGQTFFDSIEHKVSCLISVGISVAYPEKLAWYGIDFNWNEVFQKLKNLLSEGNLSKQVLHIIPPNKTLLSAINVYSAMKAFKEKAEFKYYKSKDSYIFIRLSTLLGNAIQRDIIKAFKSKDNYRLLIIDCKDVLCTFEIKKLWKILSEILAVNKSKKIILIGREEMKLADDLSFIMKDVTNFDHLTVHSKKALLRKQIIFQGLKVRFNKLIEQLDENVKEIIDVEIIHMLLKGHDIVIDKTIADLGEINDYYIPRRFKRVILEESEIMACLKKEEEDGGKACDIFIINGYDCNVRHPNVFVFEDKLSAKIKFIELCDQNTEFNVHWLENGPHGLNWYKSYGSISKINKCRIIEDADDTNLSFIDESWFVEHQHKVIISDAAGMGKSTLLTNLVLELKRKSSNLWVTRINLNDFSSVLYKMLARKSKFADLSEIEVLDFIFMELLGSLERSELEKLLLRHIFYKNGRIAILFDGFDEISPNYKDLVIDLLQSLQKCNVKKIIVTTRPNLRAELEKELQMISYAFEPLSRSEQIEFMTKFWMKKLELHLDKKDEKIIKIQSYAEYVIEHITSSIYDDLREFIGIPLQAMMIADVFQESLNTVPEEWQGCKEFVQSDNTEPKLPEAQSLFDLYKHFIKRKFYEFHLASKKKRDLCIVGESEAADNEFKLFQEKYQILALQTLFSEEILYKILHEEYIEKLKNLSESFDRYNHNDGIVNEFKDGKPHFIHRTFAEYFASFPIAEKLISCPAETLEYLDDCLPNMSPIFIHNIIELLQGHQEKITLALKKPLLEFVVDKYHNFMTFLKEINRNDWPKKLDISGKTPLHYAVENFELDSVAENLIDQFKLWVKRSSIDQLSKPGFKDMKVVKFINIRDNEGKTALNYAVQQNRIFLVVFLILEGADLESLSDGEVEQFLDPIIDPNNEFVNLFHLLALDIPTQEKLILRASGKFKNLNLKLQKIILTYFYELGNVKVTEALLGTIEDLEVRKRLYEDVSNKHNLLNSIFGLSYDSDDNNMFIESDSSVSS